MTHTGASVVAAAMRTIEMTVETQWRAITMNAPGRGRREFATVLLFVKVCVSALTICLRWENMTSHIDVKMFCAPETAPPNTVNITLKTI